MNRGRLRQVHVAVAGGFGSLIMGALNVWPSYTSDYYSSNTTTPLSEPMTKAEEALLGSLPSLGAMLGTAIAGPLINNLGRRNGGVILSLPFVISWAIISVSSSIKLILASRFFAGIPGGGFLVLTPIFISEIAEDSIRGALASMSVLLYCLGTFISYMAGWFLTYKYVIWVQLLLSAMGTLLIFLVVESPVYLFKNNRDEEARESMAKFRGVEVTSPVVIKEMTRIRNQLMPPVELISVTDTDPKAEEAEKQKLNLEEAMPEVQKMSAIKLLFVSPSSRRGFIIVWTVITMQVFMGIVPVQVYAKTVFTETDPAHTDLYSVIFAILQFFGTSVTTLIADKAGRRILLISSSILVCISMASLGALLQMGTGPAWLTICLIMMYCFSFMIGAGSMPYVLLAEMFITEVQSLASMIIVEWVWFLNFLVIAIFPFMASIMGIYGCFYIFSIVSLANAILSIILVPETKGLSNEQIQAVLRSRKKN
ncbi:unnamed protein product [Chrysodeixis includens]|uniref:Major facilitator superfamily (MFS) profile domain-containing protein n=1 Tax=Chrysodeixis includens TaxID=689277 RepID=A0A9P0BW14_CHRIL|nr:unnamed protein product [Chrysodeixis includens]